VYWEEVEKTYNAYHKDIKELKERLENEAKARKEIAERKAIDA
jgi:hypothetical protein